MFLTEHWVCTIVSDNKCNVRKSLFPLLKIMLFFFGSACKGAFLSGVPLEAEIRCVCAYLQGMVTAVKSHKFSSERPVMLFGVIIG
jgi:hypothetical protein